MYEDSIEAVLIVILIIISVRTVLEVRRIFHKSKKKKTMPLYVEVSEYEKTNFKGGMPWGIAMGIIMYLPIILKIIGFTPSPLLIFPQGLATVFYVVLLFVTALLKFSNVFLPQIKIFEKRRGLLDGFFWSFASIQLILFFKDVKILLPIQ
jgi:hypothetical protein